MADYKKAVAFVLKEEGGYVNDPDDAGGETYGGVTRKNFPSWDGWTYVDAWKHNRGGRLPNGFVVPDAEMVDCLETFYYNQFCKHLCIAQIDSQIIATMLLDWAVNAGAHGPVVVLQEIVGVAADGVMGPATVAAVNAKYAEDWFGFRYDFKKARIAFYNHLVERKPGDEKFLKGWLARVNRACVAAEGS